MYKVLHLVCMIQDVIPWYVLAKTPQRMLLFFKKKQSLRSKRLFQKYLNFRLVHDHIYFLLIYIFYSSYIYL